MKKLLLLLPSLLFLFLQVNSKVLDPNASKQHAILKSVAPSLDRFMDVVQDNNSVVSAGKKPILAPLNDYYITKVAASNYEMGKWEVQFQESLNGFSLGIKETNERLTPNSMFKAWEKAARADRVFISYASEDKFYAGEVKKALEKKGYKVFTYLSSSNKKVTCPKKIAYYLASAGNSFVIDTETSRLKYGVISEALSHQKYKLDIVNRDFETKNKLRTDFEKKIASYEEFKTKVADYNGIKKTDRAYEQKISSILKEEYGVADKASYDAIMNRSLNKIYYQDLAKINKTVSRYYPKMSAAKKSSILTSVLSSSMICPRCHLPYAFPICLAGRRR